MPNVYFEDVQVGDELPAWSRKTDLMNWNRYAAVNDEFVYIHMDEEAGRRAMNEQGVFGMGNIRYTYIVNSLHDWMGDGGLVREVGVQFRAINQKNDVLTVQGKVTDKRVEDGEHRVYLDVNVVNQDGAGTCPGHAVVVVPPKTDS
jgi:acyl dehydratase